MILSLFIACSNVWTASHFKITNWSHAFSYVIHASWQSSCWDRENCSAEASKHRIL